MMYKSINVGDLKSMIMEAKSEFKPVVGKGVKTGGKGTEKTMKTDKPGKKADYSKSLNDLGQRGMSDLRINGADKAYVDRVKSQIKGYTTTQNEKNAKGDGATGNGHYGDDSVVKAYKNHAEMMAKGKVDAHMGGLTGSKDYRSEVEGLHKPVLSTNESVSKKFVFKRTKFLSESHMLSLVPDSTKEEGKRFVMKDCDNYEYLVEWHAGKPLVEKRINDKDTEAEMARIKEMFAYKNGNTVNEGKTTADLRAGENKAVGDMLDKVRKLLK